MKIIEDAKIEIPNMYKLGFHNNNCFKTGCIQAGIGYWQKMKLEFPDKFNAMAEMEHKITQLKGEPVTMLKDQSKEAKDAQAFHHKIVKHNEGEYVKGDIHTNSLEGFWSLFIS